MSTKKTPLGGTPITRQEAYKGLGDPKTWKKQSDAVYAEFRAKPAKKKPTLLQTAARTIKKALVAKLKPHLEPVYAKKKKRSDVKHRRRKLRNR